MQQSLQAMQSTFETLDKKKRYISKDAPFLKNVFI